MTLRGAFRASVALAVFGVTLTTPEAPSFAQAGGGSQIALEEIVVTARRREENLMEIPIAISAFSATELESMDAVDLQELSSFTPGLVALPGGNGRPDRGTIQLTFRGLSVSTGLVFIDGAPYTGGQSPYVQGVERVEVLKGPQSAYFGRSTFSGAVNYVTKGVPEDFEGQVRAEVSGFGGSDTSVSLGGPLVDDKLGIRLSARHYYLKGYYKNEFDPSVRLGQEQTDSINAVVTYKASDNLDIKMFFEYRRDNDGTPYSIALKSGKDIFCDAGGRDPYLCGALPKVNELNPGVISADGQLEPFVYDVLINNSFNLRTPFFDHRFKDSFGIKRDVYIGHLNIDYEDDSGYAVNALLAYHRTKSQSVISPDYRNGRQTPNRFNVLFGLPNTLTYHRFALVTQGLPKDYNAELRVTSPQDERLRWSLGVNYLQLHAPGGNIYGVSPFGPIGTGSVTQSRTHTPAVFGGAYYDFTDDLTLTVEARYQWDRIYAKANEPIASDPLTNTYGSFSPRVSLDYNYSEDGMVYALFSRGFRPGGFNGSLVGQPQSVLDQLAEVNIKIPFDEERLDNFELGWKATWLDGRARTTVAVYHDLWRDGQIRNTTFFTTPDGELQQTTLTTNQGAVKMNGVEIDAGFAVSENLNLNATLGYTDAIFQTFFYIPEGNNIQGSPIVTGNRLDAAPKIQWSFSPQYRAPFVGEYEWYARLDWKHRGRIFIDPTNVAWAPGNDIFNLRAGIDNGTVKLEVYGENITDDKKLVSGRKGNDAIGFSERGNNRTNEIRSVLPNPRVIGIRATYNF